MSDRGFLWTALLLKDWRVSHGVEAARVARRCSVQALRIRERVKNSGRAAVGKLVLPTMPLSEIMTLPRHAVSKPDEVSSITVCF